MVLVPHLLPSPNVLNMSSSEQIFCNHVDRYFEIQVQPSVSAIKFRRFDTHTIADSMLRVKDPKESGPLTSLPYPNSQLTIGTVKFYEFFGLKQINKLDFPENKFTLYFLAYDSPNSASPNAHWTDRQGVIELTHNHGSENDPSFKIANGNSEPGKGFGHLCVSVDNIQAACQRLEDAGYKFQKKLTDGRMKSIAFALDPGSSISVE